MTKNPFLNALSALAYIVTIASVMFYATDNRGGDPDTVFAPIMVLSVFTLSAAAMGYIFLYQPIQLYMENKKKEAVDLFLRTVAIFAGFTIIIMILFLTGALS